MSIDLPIYLDHNATTPLDPRVFQAMTPYFLDAFGNAASRGHSFGFRAMRAVDQARVQVAALLGCDTREVVWTSGATESNNLAIKGVADMYRDVGRHIVTQTTEHKAVLDPCKKLSHQGYDVTFLDPDASGRVSVEQVAEAIRPDTILVSIMAANNEIGTLQPTREIGRLCHERGVLFHCDATQAVGKIPVHVEEDCIDLLSMSGHKLYGPKGAGVLYVRRKNPRVRLTPLLDGGGHEHGFRSGTLNVPGIVGVGAACELAMLEMPEESPRLAGLRDRLQAGIVARVEGVIVNGNEQHRLPQVTNLSFADVDGEQLLANVTRDLAVSSGSACTSASMEPSFVLRAIGVPNDLAYSSVRFSLGKTNDVGQIDFAVESVAECVGRVRQFSGALQSCVALVFVALTFLLVGGCKSDSRDVTHPAKPYVPVAETVTVECTADLGPFVPRAIPLVRPDGPASIDPPLEPLRPAARPFVSLNALVPYDGKFPGERSNWARWDQGVTAIVRGNLSADKPVQYQVWDEPDRKESFKGDAIDFFAVYVHTARLIRSIDPRAVLVGSSVAKHDNAWVQEFLKVAKEYDALPEVVTWHEEFRPDAAGHCGGTVESFWQDGNGRQYIQIAESTAGTKRLSPADPILLLPGVHQAARDVATRGVDVRFAFNLADCFTDDRRPRSLHQAMAAYAQLGQGAARLVKVHSSQTLDGIATWDAKGRAGQVVLGRHVRRGGGNGIPALGPATLLIKAPGGIVRLRSARIVDTGPQAAVPLVPTEAEFPVSNGESRIPLPDFESGHAYTIQFHFADAPPASAPASKPASKPTTGVAQ